MPRTEAELDMVDQVDFFLEEMKMSLLQRRVLRGAGLKLCQSRFREAG
jgi:hypothetical protein